MRQLTDILNERIKIEGGKAALGRKIGVSGEAVLQYTQGKMPSFSVALKWKQAFNENLIDLMFADEPSVVTEPVVEYGKAPEAEYAAYLLLKEDAALKEAKFENAIIRELAECQKKLIECREESERLMNLLRDKNK